MHVLDDAINISPARSTWQGVHAMFEGAEGSTVFVLACPASLDVKRVIPLRERAQQVLDQAVEKVGAALDVDAMVRGFFAPFGIVALRSEHLSALAKAAECGLKN